MDRPTVDRYFMDMTHLVKSRGTCPRRQVGAVIVKEKHVLTTGYNGAPKGFPHPIDVGCIRDELQIPSGSLADVCPCLHAEQNAIIQAATTGVSIRGADLYCTTQPCTQCSRMIANSGIARVIFHEEYADPLAIGLLTTAGVELWQWDLDSNEVHRYAKTNTWDEAQDALRQKWRKDHPDAPVPATPSATGKAATAVGAEAAKAREPVYNESGEDAGKSSAGLRDLRTDPERAKIIAKMAKDQVEKRKQALADAQARGEGPKKP